MRNTLSLVSWVSRQAESLGASESDSGVNSSESLQVLALLNTLFSYENEKLWGILSWLMRFWCFLSIPWLAWAVFPPFEAAAGVLAAAVLAGAAAGFAAAVVAFFGAMVSNQISTWVNLRSKGTEQTQKIGIKL